MMDDLLAKIRHWFTYHQPTDETAPKYAAIRAAEDRCHEAIRLVEWEIGPDSAQCHKVINEDFERFAVAIAERCPPGDDMNAALRCVRLARNAMNEGIAQGNNPRHPHMNGSFLLIEAQRQLTLARWQANSAIACGGR